MEHNFTWKNDGRTKVMIGCGTRPEIIRLAAVIKRCREYFDCCVVYYNQNWDRNLSTVFWEDFELKNTFGGPCREKRDIVFRRFADELGAIETAPDVRETEVSNEPLPNALALEPA